MANLTCFIRVIEVKILVATSGIEISRFFEGFGRVMSAGNGFFVLVSFGFVCQFFEFSFAAKSFGSQCFYALGGTVTVCVLLQPLTLEFLRTGETKEQLYRQ